MENNILDLRSGKYNPFNRIKDALKVIETKHFHDHGFGENLEIVKATNSRWMVTLWVRDKDLNKVIIFEWKKYNKDLTKEQCIFVIKELNRINLGSCLTQKTIGEMLNVSTSSIQKYTAHIKSTNAENEQEAALDLP